MRFEILALLGGCAGNDEDERETGDWASRGEDYGEDCSSSQMDVASDEQTALGFSAEDLVAAVGVPRIETGEYSDGATTEVTLAETLSGGPVVFVDREPAGDSDSDSGLWEAAAEDTGGWNSCPDYLDVAVTIAFYTDDGAFDEQLDGALRGSALDSAWLSADIDPDSVAGTWEPSLDPAEWEDVAASLSATIDGDQTTGSVWESGNQDRGDEGVAVAGIVLEWPGRDEAADTGGTGDDE